MNRDPRYTQVKNISEVAPEWSHGCASCKYGLVSAPALVGEVNVLEQRTVAHIDGLLVYCDCRAGHMYRQRLRRFAEALNEWQRNYIRACIAATTTPTIHGA